MGLKLDRKPIHKTIAGKVARRLALFKSGIDHRTPEEKKQDAVKLRDAKRLFDKTGGPVDFQ